MSRAQIAKRTFFVVAIMQMCSFDQGIGSTAPDSAGRFADAATLKFPETVLRNEPERLAFQIGHNATPTSYAMKKKTWTAGFYGVGYAVSDSLFIATSPWIWTSYNTMNITAKFIESMSSSVRAGFFAAYFQSFSTKPFLGCLYGWACNESGTPVPDTYSDIDGNVHVDRNSPFGVYVNRYQFQAAVMQALIGADIGRTTIHSGLKYSYFLNDDHPYSLRMDPGDDAIRGQLDATALVEHRLSNRVRLNLEIGSLGLTNIEPYLHIGSSIAMIFPNWLVQIGGSLTGKFGRFASDEFWMPGLTDQRRHTSRDGYLYYGRYLITALHPEVQIQYFF